MHKDQNSHPKRKNPTCRDPLSRAEFGTFLFTSIFSEILRYCEFSQNFDSNLQILVWQANPQNHQIMQKIAYQMTIWKDHKTVLFGQFSCWKKCWQVQTFICVYKLLQNHETQCIVGKIHFCKVLSLHRVSKYRLSMDNVIPWILYADWLKRRV